MKWSNKDKGERRTAWHVVSAPSREDRQAAFNWCRDHPSAGLFYQHYTNTRWWFKDKDDALLFSLRWGSSIAAYEKYKAVRRAKKNLAK